MKKKLVLAALLCTSALFAHDIVVSANTLPANAKAFVGKYFPNKNIVLVKKDLDSYDVTLNNGVQIDFIINGEWKEVDGNYQPINTAFIPQPIMQAIASRYKGASVVEIEKQINGFKVKLNNNLKVYFSQSGQLMGQKFDD